MVQKSTLLKALFVFSLVVPLLTTTSCAKKSNNSGLYYYANLYGSGPTDNNGCTNCCCNSCNSQNKTCSSLVTVSDEEGNPIEDVTIEFYGKGDPITYSTDVDGDVDLTELKNGSYFVRASKLGYETVVKNLSVYRGICPILFITLVAGDSLYCDGIFTVHDELGDPVSGAVISVFINRLQSQFTTNSSGIATITGLTLPSYNYTVSKTGYQNYSGTYYTDDLSCPDNLIQLETTVPSSCSEVTFYVMSGPDPVANTLVTFALDGNTGANYQTDENGMFAVSGISPNITHTYMLTYSDYSGQGELSFTTNSCPFETINVTQEIDTCSTTFSFMDEATGLAIDDVSLAISFGGVPLQGSPYSTTNGSIVVAELSNGSYSYTVSANGYQDKSDVYVLADDTCEPVTVLLTPTTCTTGFTFIKDAITQEPITDSVVSLTFDSPNDEYSDSTVNGVISIDLPNGFYSYTASALGYSSTTGTYTITDNTCVDQEILLTPLTCATTVTFREGSVSGPIVTNVSSFVMDSVNMTGDINNGSITISEQQNGTHYYTVTAPGYEYNAGNYIISSNICEPVTIVLTPLTCTTTITFRERSVSGPIIADISSFILNGTDLTSNINNGSLTVPGQRDGTYTYTVTAPGYDSLINYTYTVTNNVCNDQTIVLNRVAIQPPVINPNGEVLLDTSISITNDPANPDATIYYTVAVGESAVPEDPTSSSGRQIFDGNSDLKVTATYTHVKAVASQYGLYSSVVDAYYYVPQVTVVINPPEGQRKISISFTTAGIMQGGTAVTFDTPCGQTEQDLGYCSVPATVYYSVNGAAYQVYDEENPPVVTSNEHIDAYATRTGWLTSIVEQADFSVNRAAEEFILAHGTAQAFNEELQRDNFYVGTRTYPATLTAYRNPFDLDYANSAKVTMTGNNFLEVLVYNADRDKLYGTVYNSAVVCANSNPYPACCPNQNDLTSCTAYSASSGTQETVIIEIDPHTLNYRPIYRSINANNNNYNELPTRWSANIDTNGNYIYGATTVYSGDTTYAFKIQLPDINNNNAMATLVSKTAITPVTVHASRVETFLDRVELYLTNNLLVGTVPRPSTTFTKITYYNNGNTSAPQYLTIPTSMITDDMACKKNNNNTGSICYLGADALTNNVSGFKIDTAAMSQTSFSTNAKNSGNVPGFIANGTPLPSYGMYLGADGYLYSLAVDPTTVVWSSSWPYGYTTVYSNANPGYVIRYNDPNDLSNYNVYGPIRYKEDPADVNYINCSPNEFFQTSIEIDGVTTFKTFVTCWRVGQLSTLLEVTLDN